MESHAALDSVLSFEKELSKVFPPDKKYSFENRNGVLVKVYSKEFSAAYHSRLNGQVERRMRKAILRIGSFWRTAWEKAGKPDLIELAKERLSAAQLKTIEQEQALWKKYAQNPLQKDRESVFIELIGKVESSHEHECCVLSYHKSKVKPQKTTLSAKHFWECIIEKIFKWIYFLCKVVGYEG